jgi:uncharacterized membrane protein
MKIIKFIKREAINWLLISLPFIYILLVYDRMPRFAPFQIDSEQIIYYNLLFVMGLAIIMYIVLLVKPSIVPKTAFHDNLKSFHRIRTLMLVFFSFTSLIFISKEIGIPFNWSKTGFILAMGFTAVFGNLYPTIGYNYIIGIKNPWTQSNEHIWKKTHRFAGKIFFFGGLIGALYGILFNINPVPYMPVIFVGYGFTLLLIPNIYSYLLYRQLQSQNQE